MVKHILLVVAALGILFLNFVELPALKVQNKTILSILGIYIVVYGIMIIVNNIRSSAEQQKQKTLLHDINEKMQGRFGKEFKEVLIAFYKEEIWSNEGIVEYGTTRSGEEFGVPIVPLEFYQQLPATLLALNLAHITSVTDDGVGDFTYLYELTENGKRLAEEYLSKSPIISR